MTNILLCTLLAATSVEAQITTSKVFVLVTGDDCDKLTNLSLVINGDDLDTRRVKLKLDPTEVCTWKTDLGDGTISTSTAKFSLRGNFERSPGTSLEKLRSGCQKAAAKETDMSARLEFACCAKGPFRTVSVTNKPPIQATYVREVRPFAGDRIPGVKCIEQATFEGQGSIGQAQFSGEDVYLNFGQYNRKQQAPGLLIDSIVVNDRPVDLTRDDVTYRMTVQRAQGKAGSAPTLSSNAISLEIKRLTDLKLERTRIEVIK